jgi:hypothetical protein
MQRKLWPAAMVGVLLAVSGCAAHEHYSTRPAPPCHGAAWEEGHYGEHGSWHPGHWVCPTGGEKVEVIIR